MPSECDLKFLSEEFAALSVDESWVQLPGAHRSSPAPSVGGWSINAAGISLPSSCGTSVTSSQCPSTAGSIDPASTSLPSSRGTSRGTSVASSRCPSTAGSIDPATTRLPSSRASSTASTDPAGDSLPLSRTESIVSSRRGSGATIAPVLDQELALIHPAYREEYAMDRAMEEYIADYAGEESRNSCQGSSQGPSQGPSHCSCQCPYQGQSQGPPQDQSKGKFRDASEGETCNAPNNLCGECRSTLSQIAPTLYGEPWVTRQTCYPVIFLCTFIGALQDTCGVLDSFRAHIGRQGAINVYACERRAPSPSQGSERWKDISSLTQRELINMFKYDPNPMSRLERLFDRSASKQKKRWREAANTCMTAMEPRELSILVDFARPVETVQHTDAVLNCFARNVQVRYMRYSKYHHSLHRLRWWQETHPLSGFPKCFGTPRRR